MRDTNAVAPPCRALLQFAPYDATTEVMTGPVGVIEVTEDSGVVELVVAVVCAAKDDLIQTLDSLLENNYKSGRP